MYIPFRSQPEIEKDGHGHVTTFRDLSSARLVAKTVIRLSPIVKDGRCQVKMRTPKNAHPGYLFSYKYRYPGAYFHGIIGTRVFVFLVNIGTPS